MVRGLPGLVSWARKACLALFSDSTGAERAGYTPSEAVIAPAFDAIFREASGRVIVATFASQLSRVQQVIDAAHAHGRVVALAGYSMLKTVEIARKLGHLDVPAGTLVELNEALRLSDGRVTIVTTGSQGQPEAALARMADGIHRQIEIKPGDTVVLSSTPIPGNEEEVARVINKLFARGAQVIYPPLAPVHVSGHASQEEQKLMLALIAAALLRPDARRAASSARACGVGPPARHRARGYPDCRERRRSWNSRRTQAAIAGHIPCGDVFVDGSGVGDIGPKVMAERETLSRDGFVIAVVPVSAATGEACGKPELVSRGFVYLRESGDLMEQAADRAWTAGRRAMSGRARRSSSARKRRWGGSSTTRRVASLWSWRW